MLCFSCKEGNIPAQPMGCKAYRIKLPVKEFTVPIATLAAKEPRRNKDQGKLLVLMETNS